MHKYPFTDRHLHLHTVVAIMPLSMPRIMYYQDLNPKFHSRSFRPIPFCQMANHTHSYVQQLDSFRREVRISVDFEL